MIKILKIAAVTLILTSCGQTKTADHLEKIHSSANRVGDTSVIALMPYDINQYWIFENAKQADLTSQDLADIEPLLAKCIGEYNLKQEKRFNEINSKHPEYNLDKKSFVLDLKRYKRQYISVTNSDGEKEVWINCFCDTWDRDWKKELIQVKDGGNCYFNLKINLSTKKYYDFMVNGNA